jgi:uncharacterized membrane protein YfcA
MQIALLFLLGLFAGSASGVLGIGGATIIIPALVYIFGLSQHAAQGTTLALMVLPIGLLAAWYYWRSGNVNVHMAVYVAIGFFLGGLLGAALALKIPALILRKIFGVFLSLVAVKMIFGR